MTLLAAIEAFSGADIGGVNRPGGSGIPYRDLGGPVLIARDRGALLAAIEVFLGADIGGADGTGGIPYRDHGGPVLIARDRVPLLAAIEVFYQGRI